jgi:hypothetical protein
MPGRKHQTVRAHAPLAQWERELLHRAWRTR